MSNKHTISMNIYDVSADDLSVKCRGFNIGTALEFYTVDLKIGTHGISVFVDPDQIKGVLDSLNNIQLPDTPLPPQAETVG